MSPHVSLSSTLLPAKCVLLFAKCYSPTTTRCDYSLDAATVLKMFEAALDTSDALLENSSDVVLVQGFVYACRLQGLPTSPYQP